MTRNPLWLAVAGILLAACAGTPSPVLYPNAHLQTVGQAAAERDIAQCRQLASTSGVAEQRSGQVGSNAATGAAVGGASAGAWGLVRGNAAENALAGAAAGAGTAARSGRCSFTKPMTCFSVG